MYTSNLRIDQFPDRRCLLRFEGGTVCIAEKDDRHYVILDESTLAMLLDDEDVPGLTLVEIIEFDSFVERRAYLRDRFGCDDAVPWPREAP